MWRAPNNQLTYMACFAFASRSQTRRQETGMLRGLMGTICMAERTAALKSSWVWQSFAGYHAGASASAKGFSFSRGRNTGIESRGPTRRVVKLTQVPLKEPPCAHRRGNPMHFSKGSPVYMTISLRSPSWITAWIQQ